MRLPSKIQFHHLLLTSCRPWYVPHCFASLGVISCILVHQTEYVIPKIRITLERDQTFCFHSILLRKGPCSNRAGSVRNAFLSPRDSTAPNAFVRTYTFAIVATIRFRLRTSNERNPFSPSKCAWKISLRNHLTILLSSKDISLIAVDSIFESMMCLRSRKTLWWLTWPAMDQQQSTRLIFRPEGLLS